MKSLQAFLTELNTRDIKLWVEGEQLRCSAPEGMLTGELVGELQQHKQALLAFLRAGQTNGTHAPIQPIARTGIYRFHAQSAYGSLISWVAAAPIIWPVR